ncbi:MAG TPA: formyltetrahydrofolate deformylase [Rickettsiales bacterium]|nr:formyltetrahydrofolate deformylase [Rickettsiales bacterium]
MSNQYILTLSCYDVRGIVAAVSTFLCDNGGFIIESAQFGDASTGRFFLRMEFATDENTPPEEELRKLFYTKVAQKFGMEWKLHNKAVKPRVLIMVSRYGHCLNDLLHRYTTGTLPVEIPAIISNHPDFREIVEWNRIPFHHLPIEAGDKRAQESQVLDLIEEHKIELVVLARYMQVLSPELCARLVGKVINIHHSFLPGFKGAKPYHQAFDRGVKLIGATAHYVTADLDEGPIIEQEVTRVDHTYKPEDLEAVGRDSECSVLARAIKYHIEQRVLINGHKTVVFK